MDPNQNNPTPNTPSMPQDDQNQTPPMPQEPMTPTTNQPEDTNNQNPTGGNM